MASDKKERSEVVSLSFKGDADFSEIDPLLDDIYDQLENIENSKSVRSKVYSVLVEVLQNVCNYAHSDLMSGYEGQQNERMAVFKLEDTEESYEIETGNFISNEYVKILKAWLDRINSLTKEDIAKLYKEFLKNGKMSEQGGAGLGFLEIAKKSSQEWVYAFEPVDDEISFFNFKVVVNKSKDK